MSSRNQAVAMLLADMREELLVAPNEMVATEHIEKMRLEEQLTPTETVRRTPRRVDRLPMPAPVRRLVLTRPRRIAAFVAALCVLSGNFGLNSAGALPDAVKGITDRITDTIVDTFGTPGSTHSESAGEPAQSHESSNSPAARPSPTRTSTDPTPPATAPDAAPTSGSVAATPSTTPVTTSPPVTTPTPGTKPPPTTGPPTDPETPPGLPDDWRTQATNAARIELQSCAQRDGIAPAGCPQVAAIDGDAPPDTVEWTIFNEPLAQAAEIARSAGDDPAAGVVISVYGQFQMGAAYTVGGDDAHKHFAYSAGIAEATMTWDGSSIHDVTFTSGSVADQLPEGVTVPGFERHAAGSDEAMLAATQVGIYEWSATAAGSFMRDPLDGATVAFDPDTGSFTVSNSYLFTPNDGGETRIGEFTATLLYEGDSLFLVGISGL